MLLCEVTEVGPERVGLDIGDDHRLPAVGGGAAGTGRLGDRDPVDRVVVGIWQARRGTVLEVPAVIATQQHGRPGVVLEELLGDADDRREHFGQRRSLGHQQQYVALGGQQPLQAQLPGDVFYDDHAGEGVTVLVADRRGVDPHGDPLPIASLIEHAFTVDDLAAADRACQRRALRGQRLAVQCEAAVCAVLIRAHRRCPRPRGCGPGGW